MDSLTIYSSSSLIEHALKSDKIYYQESALEVSNLLSEMQFLEAQVEIEDKTLDMSAINTESAVEKFSPEILEIRKLAEDASIPTIRALLKQYRSNQKTEIRSEIITRLGMIGKVCPELVGGFLIQEFRRRKMEPCLKVDLLKAMGNLKYDFLIGKITPHLFDEKNASVRAEVARTLGKLSDGRSTASLRRALDQEENPEVQRKIIWALTEFKDLNNLPIFLHAFHDSDNTKVRLQALNGIVKIPKYYSFKLRLYRTIFLKEDKDFKIEALRYISHLGIFTCLAYVAMGLKDPEPEVQLAALKLFKKLEIKHQELLAQAP